MFLNDGANVDLARRDGMAAQHGYEKIVAELVQSNAATELAIGNNSTALFIAAQNDHSRIVKMLLDADADTEASLSSGATSLFSAASHKLLTSHPW